MSESKDVIFKAENRQLRNFTKENEEKWSGPFVFIQAADTQFGMIEGYVEKKEFPGWTEEIALTKKAIQAANRMKPKPKFFIVCGDLVDAMPDKPNKDAQIKDFRQVFSDMDSDIPLICVCGNHDIGNTPTAQTVEKYRSDFGDDYFSFWSGGMKCIVLNSQFYEDSSLVPELAEAQEVWLEQELKDCKSAKHALIFQHIPWFLSAPDEPKEYFNIVPELRMKMLERFRKAGVKVIFCGHYHRNAGGFYKDLELVVTSAIGAQLGSDLSGLRVVRVLEDGIKHQYYDLDHVPEIIDLQQ